MCKRFGSTALIIGMLMLLVGCGSSNSDAPAELGVTGKRNRQI